jgi:ApbE superfamily uncharacterized protein (UPF0280 family)
MGPQVSFLSDGRRLHLHHGPIDLIVQAEGPGREAGLRRGIARFETILSELASELAALRSPVGQGRALHGPVARAMQRAAVAHNPAFVTPMAAVAGAVADDILRAICAGPGMDRVHVNNGGDIAFHLAPGQQVVAAIAGAHDTRLTIGNDSPVRGIATSGWRGRSQSLGIADTVTVLAATAAEADVAATLIANAVDLPGHPSIARRRATEVFPDSDLGDRLVTVAVDALTPNETDAALERGTRHAERCLSRGLIHGAFLGLNGRGRVVGGAELSIPNRKEPLHA